MQRFANQDVLKQQIAADIARCVGSALSLEIHRPPQWSLSAPQLSLPGRCLDEMPAPCTTYRPDLSLLRLVGQDLVDEVWYSHLLCANCPVTNLPDWGTVWIGYRGQQLCPRGLLQYVVSYRQHQGFHEQCVEQMFAHLLTTLGDPQALWVYARFNRRGGIDINPYRCLKPSAHHPQITRLVRQ